MDLPVHVVQHRLDLGLPAHQEQVLGIGAAGPPVADPMAELQRAQGRFLYFAPDELEPIGTAGGPGQEQQE